MIAYIPGHSAKKDQESITLKVYLKKLSKLILSLSWHNCLLYKRGVERHLSLNLLTMPHFVCFPILTMDKNIKQGVCLKFCIANRTYCADALEMLYKAFGESTF